MKCNNAPKRKTRLGTRLQTVATASVGTQTTNIEELDEPHSPTKHNKRRLVRDMQVIVPQLPNKKMKQLLDKDKETSSKKAHEKLPPVRCYGYRPGPKSSKRGRSIKSGKSKLNFLDAVARDVEENPNATDLEVSAVLPIQPIVCTTSTPINPEITLLRANVQLSVTDQINNATINEVYPNQEVTREEEEHLTASNSRQANSTGIQSSRLELSRCVAEENRQQSPKFSSRTFKSFKKVNKPIEETRGNIVHNVSIVADTVNIHNHYV